MKAFYAKALRGDIETFSVEERVVEWGLATGLYPNEHSVVANEIYEIGKGYLNAGYPELFHHKDVIYPLWSIPSIITICVRQTLINKYCPLKI